MNPSTSSSTKLTAAQTRAVEAAASGKIKRPMNSWVQFLSARSHQLRDSGMKMVEKAKMISKEWSLMSKEERIVWVEKAKQAKLEHEAQYPGYKYMPGPTKKSKHEKQKQGDTTATNATASSSSSRKRKAKGRSGPRAPIVQTPDSMLESAVSQEEEITALTEFRSLHFDGPSPFQQQSYEQLAMANFNSQLSMVASDEIQRCHYNIAHMIPSSPSTGQHEPSPPSALSILSVPIFEASTDPEAGVKDQDFLEPLYTKITMPFQQETWSQLGLSNNELDLDLLDTPAEGGSGYLQLRDISSSVSSCRNSTQESLLDLNYANDNWGELPTYPTSSRTTSHWYPNLEGSAIANDDEEDKENRGRRNFEECRRDDEALKEMLSYTNF